jgi:hypothetical protein
MWEQLRRSDVERAKQKLAELRIITLRRHEEELKQLDTDEAEIETLARLAAAVTEKYLNGGTHSEEDATPAGAVEGAVHPEVQPETIPPPNLRTQQQVSPNFGTPLRRLVNR